MRPLCVCRVLGAGSGHLRHHSRLPGGLTEGLRTRHSSQRGYGVGCLCPLSRPPGKPGVQESGAESAEGDHSPRLRSPDPTRRPGPYWLGRPGWHCGWHAVGILEASAVCRSSDKSHGCGNVHRPLGVSSGQCPLPFLPQIDGSCLCFRAAAEPPRNQEERRGKPCP